MKIAIAQVNTRIGDISYNQETILKYMEKAQNLGCSIVCFPEFALTGYPPCDLLYNPEFIRRCEESLDQIAKSAEGVDVLLGTVVSDPNSGETISCSALLTKGTISAIFPKIHLESYEYFDEGKYFVSSNTTPYIIEYDDVKLGIITGQLHSEQMLNYIDESGTDIFINISASPYYYGRQTERIEHLSRLAKTTERAIVYVNMVGGNNELVFDGGSMVIDRRGKLCAKALSFEEDLLIWTVDDTQGIDIPKEDISYMYKALTLGLRDYCMKLGVEKILLGLSGGVDSALAACLATEAVGADRVLAISNHSKYTSKESREDASKLAQNLGIEYREMPIDALFRAYIGEFNEGANPIYDLAEENIQARIRGDIWMFISNREGYMVISASNKSELNVGYTTLYGDMSGGLAPLSDVYKTQVYSLCHFVNRQREIIPNSIIAKAPSAELRPDQRDEDSLPPYSILDKVLYLYLEEGIFEEDIIARGYDRDIVYRITNMVERSEYKRRQAAPPIRISKGWFIRPRSMPIVHGFRSE